MDALIIYEVHTVFLYYLIKSLVMLSIPGSNLDIVIRVNADAITPPPSMLLH
jgi:hypothetical protein